jgi:hypothetical protein
MWKMEQGKGKCSYPMLLDLSEQGITYFTISVIKYSSKSESRQNGSWARNKTVELRVDHSR